LISFKGQYSFIDNSKELHKLCNEYTNYTSSLVVVAFPCLVALAEEKVEINSGQLSPLPGSAYG